MARPATRRGSRGAGPAAADPVLLAGLAKALAHPARIWIVQQLLERGECMGADIVDGLGLAQSTTAEHLRILRAAGIIHGEVDRPRVTYSLSPPIIAPLASFLASLSEATPPERAA